jgi:hypothetical protein
MAEGGISIRHLTESRWAGIFASHNHFESQLNFKNILFLESSQICTRVEDEYVLFLLPRRDSCRALDVSIAQPLILAWESSEGNLLLPTSTYSCLVALIF